jgi:D-tyrosyl-tRNA(Tyr) deacylase
MRAVVQRVSEAAVRVDGAVAAQIGAGLVVLLGVGKGDSDSDAEYLAEKVAHLRILDDDAGQMNRSVLDTAGQVLVVSQFTLYGDVRRGRRPGWSDAAPPEEARRLYEQFVTALRGAGITVETGVFRATMRVALVNEGPVTLLLDSRRLF